jgi:hypothetical protein
MLETIMNSDSDLAIDVAKLKIAAKEHGKDIKDESDYDKIEADFIEQFRAKPLVVADDSKEPEPTDTKEKHHA